MDSVKEHESKFGKFYSEWAFVKDYEDIIEQNKDVCFLLKKSSVNGNHQTPPLMYDKISYGPAHTTYKVVSKPDWMTMDEVALVIDNGNLCFGYYVNGNTIDIYTD